jgi:LuxR family maltose regulon positive regulatory protein
MENISLQSIAPRTALMELIDKLIIAKRMLYIHAPAGYGKTFTARMWLEHKTDASAWVAINESSGRKPSEFYERFALALLSLQPNNATLRELITHKSFSAAAFELAESAVKSFFNFDLLNHRKDKTFLVFDDLHLITNADTKKMLPELMRELPENMTLIVISRAEPPESFSEYVVRDWMAVLDVENLRFTENEIMSFFASRDRKLNAKQMHDVMTATGGWAIGLNALLLSDSQKYSEKKLNRYLESFIREQVWEKWDGERCDFLLRVSVSDELTPDFCDAMTGRAKSDSILRRVDT